MKLIPPVITDSPAEPETKNVELAGNATVLKKPAKILSLPTPSLEAEKKHAENLAVLNDSILAFGKLLDQILQNVNGLIRNVGGAIGHTGSRRQTGVGNGSVSENSTGETGMPQKKRGRPRKDAGSPASAATAAKSTGSAVGTGKRRGRPKGSKNRSTIEREQAERAAKRAARVAAKQPVKPAAKRAAGRKPKPAAKNTARKGGQTGGRKAARKGTSKKR
jgi:hypothetical protein